MRNKILSALLAIVMLMSTMPLYVFATGEDVTYVEDDNTIFSDDNVTYLSYEEYLVNRAIMDEYINQKHHEALSDDNTEVQTFSAPKDELDQKLNELGYYKLSEEQKNNYLDVSINNDVSLTGAGVNEDSIYYPSITGMDMYVTYFTYNNEEMAEVQIVLNKTEGNSSLVRIYDAVEIYDNVTFSELAVKSVKTTLTGVVTGGLSLAQGITLDVLMGLAEPFIPTTSYSNEATLTLKVSTVSTISHMWRKTNGRFFFRLATNMVTVKESWVFVDSAGDHYYTYNEFNVESPQYRNVSIAATHTDSTSFSVPDYKYKSKGLLGIYFNKLTVSPYYAPTPQALAFN